MEYIHFQFGAAFTWINLNQWNIYCRVYKQWDCADLSWYCKRRFDKHLTYVYKFGTVVFVCFFISNLLPKSQSSSFLFHQVIQKCPTGSTFFTQLKLPHFFSRAKSAVELCSYKDVGHNARSMSPSCVTVWWPVTVLPILLRDLPLELQTTQLSKLSWKDTHDLLEIKSHPSLQYEQVWLLVSVKGTDYHIPWGLRGLLSARLRQATPRVNKK